MNDTFGNGHGAREAMSRTAINEFNAGKSYAEQ